MILDCKPIAQKIVDVLLEKPKTHLRLAGLLIGSDPASVSFLKQQKGKTAERLNIHFEVHEFPEAVKEGDILKVIQDLAKDRTVGGIILQLPLPKHLDRAALIQAIPIEKDVDALRNDAIVLPPAAGALKAILETIDFSPSNKKAAVVGKGLLVGAPIAEWLSNEGAMVTAMDKASFDPSVLREADIIVSGAGVAHLIAGDMVKEGALCIDFGYAKKNVVLTGDFDSASVGEKAAYLTPTPGGTGPVLVAKLFENFFTLLGKN